jgi:hypothetical protein
MLLAGKRQLQLGVVAACDVGLETVHCCFARCTADQVTVTGLTLLA